MRRRIFGVLIVLTACSSEGDPATTVVRTIDDPAPDASPWGANCGQDDECDSNRCVDFHCTVACEPDDPRACRDVVGLCALGRNGRHSCIGDVSTGADPDDRVLRPGQRASANLCTPGDADVVRLAVPRGDWRVVAAPAAGVDLALDFYDARALALGRSDEGVGGAAERVTWHASDENGAFVVVRHVGGATGSYDLRIETVRP